MKKVLTLLLVAICLVAEAQIKMPDASPSASVTTTVGLTDVKIVYSRPKMKGRKIFGAGSDFLVPFGEIWRTGANNGTVVTFSDDVKVEGTDVKKGDYLLLTIPGAAEWTVILYSDVALGGNTSAYDKTKDAARITVKSEKLSEKVETFTMNISDLSDNSTTANIQLAWENTSVKFAVAVDYDSKVMKSIETGTKVAPGNYVAAANYYFNSGKDLKQALEWMTLGIETGNQTAFWNIHTKAKIQDALGDKAGALATAQKSLDLAKKAEGDFGYIKLNEDLIKKLNEDIAKMPKKKK